MAPQVFFAKGKTFFSIVSLHLTVQSKNNGTFASEPLHTCTETECSTHFFFETENGSRHARKTQVLPGLRPCNAALVLPLSQPFTLLADRLNTTLSALSVPTPCHLGQSPGLLGHLRWCHSWLIAEVLQSHKKKLKW